MQRLEVVTDIFNFSYQILVGPGKPHPAARVLNFNDAFYAVQFLRHLCVEEAYWQRRFVDAIYPGQSIYETLAPRLLTGRIRFARLPRMEDAPISHDGKGNGYAFFRGPRLPTLEDPCVTFTDAAQVQQFMTTVKAPPGGWYLVLEQAGLWDDSRPLNRMSVTAIEEKVAGCLLDGLLCAYTFPYTPAKRSTPVEYEPVGKWGEPVPLAPPTEEPAPKKLSLGKKTTGEQTSDSEKPVIALNAGQASGKQGVKGTWSEELENPQPNTIYKVTSVHDGQPVTYTYETDDNGRTVRVTGKLTKSAIQSQKERDALHRNPTTQSRYGGDDSDYDGGHLIATLFQGPAEKINLAKGTKQVWRLAVNGATAKKDA